MVVAFVEEPRPFLFSQEQYRQMVERGWFAGVANNGPNGEGNGQEPRLRAQRRFTRSEYYQMGEWGWFIGRRIMLIEGEILEMPIQKPQHYVSIDQTAKMLERVFTGKFWIRTQAPLDLGEATDAEPDVSVVDGSSNDYLDHHPTTARLLVESSDTTLRFDREHKGSLYARAGIADYWIINLVDRQLEIRRRPVPDSTQDFNFGYADLIILKPGDFATPLAAPQSRIAVADLLPK